MTLKARYCAECGAPTEIKTVEDRPREVCPTCGQIFYRNPLPVAAAVVLNDRREILLVKRRNRPYQGEWCLPMGFAETGETIAHAAGRELEEETGIQAEILRLLDADSYASDHYGDLLIVTFELEKRGGTETPGDDAEEVAYYALDALPNLPFTSNQTAIQACVQAHEEEWAIRDSFRNLQEESAGSLLSDVLIALVREHADEVAGTWLEEVRTNPTTTSYQRIDPVDLGRRCAAALSHFSRWLETPTADRDIRTFGRALGRERREQGFDLHEVISSLSLLRKHVWLYARDHGVWERPIDVYRVLELNRRIVAFFDKVVYHTARGFAEAG